MNNLYKTSLILTFATLSQFQAINVKAADDKVQVLAQSQKASNSDWYFHVDLKAVRSSLLGEKFLKESNHEFAIFNTVLGKGLIDKAHYITVQGAMEGDHKTLLIQGDFANSQSELKQKWNELGFGNTTKYNNKTINHGSLITLADKVIAAKSQLKGLSKEEQDLANLISLEKDDSDKAKETHLYLAQKSANTLVISGNIEEVKAWLHDEKQWNPSKQSNVFEVIVDIEKSMLHGGVNLQEATDNFEFQSISAKQLSKVSATYNEFGSDAEIQVGLTTSDSETATKVKSVAHGLIALKMLSNSSRAVANLLATIQLEQDAENLMLRLSGPVESFQALLENK